MAGKNTPTQWILFMVISALAIMLMAVSFMDKEWLSFGLAFVSFVCNTILMKKFRNNKK